MERRLFAFPALGVAGCTITAGDEPLRGMYRLILGGADDAAGSKLLDLLFAANPPLGDSIPSNGEGEGAE